MRADFCELGLRQHDSSDMDAVDRPGAAGRRRRQARDEYYFCEESVKRNGHGLCLYALGSFLGGTAYGGFSKLTRKQSFRYRGTVARKATNAHIVL